MAKWASRVRNSNAKRSSARKFISHGDCRRAALEQKHALPKFKQTSNRSRKNQKSIKNLSKKRSRASIKREVRQDMCEATAGSISGDSCFTISSDDGEDLLLAAQGLSPSSSPFEAIDAMAALQHSSTSGDAAVSDEGQNGKPAETFVSSDSNMFVATEAGTEALRRINGAFPNPLRIFFDMFVNGMRTTDNHDHSVDIIDIID